MTWGRSKRVWSGVPPGLGGTPMGDFGVFCFDPEGNVCEAMTLSCANEAEAIAAFESLCSNRPMELWSRGRRLKTYSPEAQSPASPPSRDITG
jgi:hypothetical protein